MTESQLNPPDSDRVNTEALIRSLLFDKAAAANLRLQNRIDAAAEDLGRSNALGVIGAIEGADEDIKAIRAFMLLIRDHFPHPTQ